MRASNYSIKLKNKERQRCPQVRFEGKNLLMGACQQSSSIMTSIQAHNLCIDNNQRHNFMMARYICKLIQHVTPTQHIEIQPAIHQTPKADITDSIQQEPMIDDDFLNLNTPLIQVDVSIEAMTQKILQKPKCLKCGQVFAAKFNLKRHMELKHKDHQSKYMKHIKKDGKF